MQFDLPRNYEYLMEQKDLVRVIEWIKSKKSFCVDTETKGLNPFQNELILIQIGDEEKQWIIDNRTIDILPLKPYLESEEWLKILQNAKFDYKVLAVKKRIHLRRMVDTMITEQILRCGFKEVSASMEALADRYLGIKIDKEDSLRASFGQTGPGEFTERQLQYASGDVIYPCAIIKRQKPKIIQKGLMQTLTLENKVIPVIAKMELAGMGIDKAQWLKLYQEAVIQQSDAEKVLDQYFGIRAIHQGSFFDEGKIIRAIDYESKQQLKKGLEKLGINIPNTRRDTLILEALNGVIPKDLAQAILTYRIASKRTSTYGKSFLDAIEPATGRIHSDFTQDRTTTGRLSSGEDDDSDSDKVNFQNIPGASAYRGCFIPKPGYKLIVYDYQAIEPRILGEISQDPTYVDTFQNNKDIYSEVGTKMLKEEVSKKDGRPLDLRNKTKITVLGNSYGTGKDKFFKKIRMDLNWIKGKISKETVQITREESDRLWESFFEACPQIKITLDQLSALANPHNSERRVYDEVAAMEAEWVVKAKIEEGFKETPWPAEKIKKKVNYLLNNRGKVTYSESLGGRKRFFKVYHQTSWTEGRNHPIQSTAADILKTAMVMIDAAIADGEFDAQIVNQVHDELIIEVREDQAEVLNKIVKTKCEEAESKFLRTIPPKVEGGIKDKWEK